MPERDWDREREWDRGRRHRGEGYRGEGYRGEGYRGEGYRGEGYYGGGEADYYPGDRERGRDRGYDRRYDDRGFLERAGDEVRSWFGDESASRRRARDDREPGRGGWGERGGGSEDVDPEWARQWGYAEGRGRRGFGRGGARDWGVGSGAEAGAGYQGEAEHGPSRGGWGWGSERGARGGAYRGSFAGKGPRGYQRSDDRIREDICERMCDNDELDPSDIEIVVVSGEVTLQGSVHDRYDKRLAEDITERVSGVRDVNNQLRVSQSTSGQSTSGQGTSGQGTSGQEDQPSQNRPGDPPRYRVA